MEIKLLEEDDWDSFKSIRLEALLNSPSNFGSYFEVEEKYDEVKFREIMNHNFIFGIFESDQIIASAAIGKIPNPRRIHIGQIWAVYTKPDFRRRNLSSKLISHIVNFAKNHFMQLKLSVNTDNLQAMKAYKNAGFIEYGREPRALKIGDKFEDITLMYLMLDS